MRKIEERENVGGVINKEAKLGEINHVHLARDSISELSYVDSVGVNDVSNKSKHGNASMLDFRFAKETDGGFGGGVPEALLGQTQRVEESNDRIAFLSQISKVG